MKVKIGNCITSIKSINWHEFAASQYHLGYYYLQNIEDDDFTQYPGSENWKLQ